MKKISICICCYNESPNIVPMINKIESIMNSIPSVAYEIIFSDNASSDGSPELLKAVADKDKKVKVILNLNNYGPARSGRNCIYNASGDAIIAIPCDFQEPPEMIPTFINEWLDGNLIVWGQKIASEENKCKYLLRTLYYKIICILSEYPQFMQTSGFGIMDKSVINNIKKMNEPEKSFRHMVAELGYTVKLIPYKQAKRKQGKSSYNIKRMLDFSIKSLVNTSKAPIRVATILGIMITALSAIGEMIWIIVLLLARNIECWIWVWRFFVILIMGILLSTLGFVGEYLLALKIKLSEKPLVIEKERINF